MLRQLLAACLLMGAVVAALVASRKWRASSAPHSPVVHFEERPAPPSPEDIDREIEDEFRAPEVVAPTWPYGMEVTNEAWSFRTYVHASVPPIRIVARGQVEVKDYEGSRDIDVDDFKGLELFWDGDEKAFQSLGGSEWYQEAGLVVSTSFWRDPSDFQGVWIADFNFDGFQDIALASTLGRDRTWDAWLFQPKSRRFARAELPGNAFLVPEKKEIWGSDRISLGQYSSRRYRWEQRKLVLLEEWETLSGESETHTSYQGPKPITTTVNLSAPETPASCRRSEMCKEAGYCSASRGECVRTPEGCEHSEDCKKYGACGAGKSSCSPTESGCQSSQICKSYGWCKAGDRQCIPGGGGCAQSRLCTEYGRCTDGPEGECIAAKDEDCSHSQVCVLQGRCRALSAWCVPK